MHLCGESWHPAKSISSNSGQQSNSGYQTSRRYRLMLGPQRNRIRTRSAGENEVKVFRSDQYEKEKIPRKVAKVTLPLR